MSEENIEIVRMYEAYLRGHAEESLRDVHPEFLVVVEDGLITRITGYIDPRDTLAAAGGSE